MRINLFKHSNKGSLPKNYEAEFKQVYEKTYDKAYKLAAYLCKDEDNTKDILSDFYMKLWSKKIDFNTVQKIDNYIYLAVRNETLNFLKKNNNIRFLELNKIVELDLKDEVTPIECLYHKETKKHIQKAIEELPEKRKVIFKQSRFENKSTQEIATAYGISIKTVEDHIRKSVIFLRQRLPELNGI